MTDILRQTFETATEQISEHLGSNRKYRIRFWSENGLDVEKYLSKALVSKVDERNLLEKYRRMGCDAFERNDIEIGVLELVFSPDELLKRNKRIGSLSIEEVNDDIKPLIETVVSTVKSSNN